MDTLPAGDFAREVGPLVRAAHARLPAALRTTLRPAFLHSVGVSASATLVAPKDLSAAMELLRVPGAQREDFLARLRKARETWSPEDIAAVDMDEFRLYLQGAAAARAGRCADARAAWKAVLALPADQRRYRGVWAAYMLARSYAGVGQWACGTAADGDSPAAAEAHRLATKWFARTRELAAQGLADKAVGVAADRLGLGVESFGWEARAALERGDLDRAIELYAAQASFGDSGALLSLQMLAAQLIRAPDEALVGHAKAPARRTLLTAWLLAQDRYALDAGLPEDQQVWDDAHGLTVRAPHGAPDARWLRALEAAHARAVQGADRVAWLAYRAGHFDQAARWLKRASGGAGEPSAVALWMSAKLAIRAGDLRQGAKLLGKATRAFAEGERWRYDGGPSWDSWESWGVFGDGLVPKDRARAERAILALVRDEMPQALELLARTGYWTDAAFVAERLVTTRQLKRLVDRSFPAEAARGPQGEEPADLWDYRNTPAGGIRYLLGRRLVREGRAAEAAPYFPPSLRPVLARYVELSKRVKASGLEPRARAAVWWELALLTRQQGMELMGYENAPDWTWAAGNYELDDATQVRAKMVSKRSRFAPTKAERRAWKRTAAKPYKRFHYRYLAAKRAAKAAALLGPDDEAGDRMLCVATRWLLKRDPEAARVYYRAFLKRNNLRPWAERFGQDCPAVPPIGGE